MTPLSRLLLTLAACAVALAASPAHAADPPLVSTEPGLFPAYRASVADYAIRCEPAGSATVSVVAPPGTTVAVDGGTARSGAFEVPVTLADGQRFAFTVQTPAKTTTHHARCLPEDFPSWTASRTRHTQSAFHLVALADLAIAFDRNGVPVWWWRQPPGVRVHDFKRLPNGHLAWADVYDGGFAINPAARYQQRRLDGRLVRQIKTVGSPTDHHDLVQLPNGNQLAITYRRREHVDLSPWGGQADATVVDGEVQELARGRTRVWSWNSEDHITPAEARTVQAAPNPATGMYDLVHLNAVEPTADGNLLLSARNTDAVYKIDRDTGAVIWKLGGKPTPESLTLPAGLGAIGAQHDVRELPDGTITIHDNGSGLERPPRSLRLTIDETARTATLVDEVDDPEVARSNCCGSSRLLPGGTWVMSWGGAGLVTEFTPAGDRAFRMAFATGSPYRDNVIPPGVMTAGQFRAGMDAQHPR